MKFLGFLDLKLAILTHFFNLIDQKDFFLNNSTFFAPILLLILNQGQGTFELAVFLYWILY